MTSDACCDTGRPPASGPASRVPDAGATPRPAVRSLLAVLAAVALAGCSSGTPGGAGTVTVRPTAVAVPTTLAPTPPSTTTTTARLVPPQTYDEALEHLATGTPAAGTPTAFTSPTGNIVCTILAGGKVRGCELRKGRIAAPTPTFCAGAGGGATDIGRVQLTASGPVAVCNKDAVAAPGAPVLEYGSRTQSGSVGCISESIGMTCVDTSTGKGFFLARDTFFIV